MVLDLVITAQNRVLEHALDMNGLHAYFRGSRDHLRSGQKQGIHRYFSRSEQVVTESASGIPKKKETEETETDVIMTEISDTDSEVQCMQPLKLRRTLQHQDSRPLDKEGKYAELLLGTTFSLPRVEYDSAQAPSDPAEALAMHCFMQGEVTWDQIARLLDLLPAQDKIRWRQEEGQLFEYPKSFMTGAWARGPQHGITRNARAFPLVSRLLSHIIQSVDPEFHFSSCTLSRNVCAKPHRDSHNAKGSWNLVIPCSRFEGGEIWVQQDNGAFLLQQGGHPGHMWPATTPTRFNPSSWHATSPWTGVRIVLIGFHVKHVGKLLDDDRKLLISLGFRPDPALD
ncbi:Pol [Symbiodinium sp. CCMP2592]|nr:Pol [Symbiodinium sp. CCMP2592]